MRRIHPMMLAGSLMLLTASVLLAQPGTITVPPDRAVLMLTVPAGAQVAIGGQPTRQTGTQRIFTTPPLEPGFQYSYDVVVHWKEGQKDLMQKRTITFRPGQLATGNFTSQPKTQPEQKVAKKTEAEKKIAKKTEPEKRPALNGTVQSVDYQKGAFTLKGEGGKTRTFLVNESTKFVGAKGGSRGMGNAGLKDEGMTQGTAIRVVAAPDDRAALEVYLPARKTPATKDKK